MWNTIVLLLFLIGNVLTVVSLAAEILGLDLTPGFGMVQMFQLLLGITFLTLAGFLHIYRLRDPDSPRSLQAEIGVRLAATGTVFAYVSGLSDLLGIGTHVDPRFERPYVGPLQLGGLVLGIISITAGLLLYYTSRGSRETSALEFLLNRDEELAENTLPEQVLGEEPNPAEKRAEELLTESALPEEALQEEET